MKTLGKRRRLAFAPFRPWIRTPGCLVRRFQLSPFPSRVFEPFALTRTGSAPFAVPGESAVQARLASHD